MKYLIIDGYNAIAKIREFDAKKDISLESSRLSFIKALLDFRARNKKFNKIVIVFDGKGDGLGLERESHGDVEVVFSNKAKDADKAIVDMLKILSGKNNAVVCSDDNFVKNHSRAFGCEVMSIRGLEDLISLKKVSPRGRIMEKEIGHKDQDHITNELKKYWGVE